MFTAPYRYHRIREETNTIKRCPSMYRYIFIVMLMTLGSSLLFKIIFADSIQYFGLNNLNFYTSALCFVYALSLGVHVEVSSNHNAFLIISSYLCWICFLELHTTEIEKHLCLLFHIIATIIFFGMFWILIYSIKHPRRGKKILILSGFVSFCHFMFTAILYFGMSHLKYTYFWDGYYAEGCYKSTENRIFNEEYQRFDHADAFLGELVQSQSDSLMDSKPFNAKLCTVILTSSKRDQSKARNELDYFNTTLASLLYAYNIYKSNQTSNGTKFSQINDDIIIYEYASTKNEEQSYKQQYVEEYGQKDVGTKLKYEQNVFDSENWHINLVNHHLDAMNNCKHSDENIEYALLIQDDVLIGDAFYSHLDKILNELIGRQKNDWLYLKLFHTEHWEGWNYAKIYDLPFLAFVFIISIALIHCFYIILNRNVNTSKIRIRILMFIYLCFGASCTWFVFGVGKQNIVYYYRAMNWNEQLLTYDQHRQGVMAQASLYNLKHTDELKEFYKNEGKKKQGFDILIGDYSEANDLDILMYYPSLVQHLGRCSSSNKNSKCSFHYLKQSRSFVTSSFV